MSTNVFDMQRRLRQNQLNQQSAGGLSRGLAQSAAGQTNPRTLPLPNPFASAPLRSDPNSFTRRARFGPTVTGAGAPTGPAQVPNPTPVRTPSLARPTGGGLETRARSAAAPPITRQQISDLQVAAIRAQHVGGARDPQSVQYAQQYLDGVGRYNAYAAENQLPLMVPAPGITNLLQSGDLSPTTQGPVPQPTWPSNPDPRYPQAPDLGLPLPPGYTQPPTGSGNNLPSGSVQYVDPTQPPDDTGGGGPVFDGSPGLGTGSGRVPIDDQGNIIDNSPGLGTGGGGTGGGGTGGGGTGGGGTGGGGTGGGGTGGGGVGGQVPGIGEERALPGQQDFNVREPTVAPTQSLVAPTEAQGAEVATYTPAQAVITPDATVEGRLVDLFTEGNPLLARAQQGGLEIAQSRGLLNSSMGAQAGVAAMLDQALNIATPDAAAMQTAIFRNVDAINSALQYNTEAQNMVNRADQLFRQEWSQNQQAFNNAALLSRQEFEQTSGLQGEQAELQSGLLAQEAQNTRALQDDAYRQQIGIQRDQTENAIRIMDEEYANKSEFEKEILQPGRVELQRIQGEYQVEIQNNATVGSLVQGMMTAAASVYGNDRFSAQTQADIVNGLAAMTRDAIDLTTEISGFADRVPQGGFGTGEPQVFDLTITNPDGSTSTVDGSGRTTLSQGQSTTLNNGRTTVTSVASGEGGSPYPYDDIPTDEDTTIYNADGSIAYRQWWYDPVKLEPGQYIGLPGGGRLTGG